MSRGVYSDDKGAYQGTAGGGGGEANTASNLGAGDGVFASKVGVDLQFKSLIEGTNITLTATATDITIDAAGGAGGLTHPQVMSRVSLGF